MAGFYPDVPAPRMAYDRDGSVLAYTHIATSTVQAEYGANSAHSISMNNESATNFKVGTWGVATVGITTIFPQMRTLVGYTFIRAYTYNGNWGSIQRSSNTTNGIDGTWTTIETTQTITFDAQQMRNNIRLVTPVEVKAIRFTPYTGTGGGTAEMWYHGYHLYGTIVDGQTVDRLRLWHPTLDEPLDDNTSADGAWLDWGDTVRGTSADKIFRIKNNSTTLTANSIDLSPQTLTDTSPTVVSQMTLSDGGTFGATLNIGNLSPGAISNVITLRRSTASNAALSLWTGRINVNPGSWS